MFRGSCPAAVAEILRLVTDARQRRRLHRERLRGKGQLAGDITFGHGALDGKKMVEIPNVLGDVTAQPVPGVVMFKVSGEEQRLTALGGDAKTGLFFVFNDLTAKSDTYPGGRFLDSGPVVDGHVVLDFNRAYNPPCAVTPYATCPLAPKENRLAVAIPAGEKFDKAAHAHH